MQMTASPLAAAVLALYYLILGVLAFYGVHRMVLLVAFLRTRRRGPAPPPAPSDWPVVTVQLPLYNEMYVARRLIDAVCRLAYPHDRLQIQVLDDSTDETTEIVAERVAHHRRRGVDIQHLHRSDRRGFKAGALAAGLTAARGELLAVFDADFIPPRDFLRQAVPHLVADPGLGLVQARWEHLNRDYSLLTRIQAIFLDGHFLIEHAARNRSGCFFNFNGTAGIWRRQAILEAGGWDHDTLTEDLDLSYRAQLAGWRFLFLPDLPVPSELPVDVNGFKSQQDRWTRGSVQSGRKLLARVLKARLPLRVKAEAFVHLTNNLAYLLMFLLSLLIFPAMVLRRHIAMETLLLVDLPLFLAATVSVLAFYAASQVAAGPGWGRRLWLLPSLMGLGIGLSVNNGRAVLGGLFSSGGTFRRTPKYALARRRQSWAARRYRVRVSGVVVVEGLLALYFAVCVVWAAVTDLWLSIPFLYLFLQGYTYIFLLTVVPSISQRFERAREHRELPAAG